MVKANPVVCGCQNDRKLKYFYACVCLQLVVFMFYGLPTEVFLSPSCDGWGKWSPNWQTHTSPSNSTSRHRSFKRWAQPSQHHNCTPRSFESTPLSTNESSQKPSIHSFWQPISPFFCMFSGHWGHRRLSEMHLKTFFVPKWLLLSLLFSFSWLASSPVSSFLTDFSDESIFEVLRRINISLPLSHFRLVQEDGNVTVSRPEEVYLKM